MLLWIAGSLLILAGVAYGWVMRHPTFDAVQRGKIAANQSDVAAVAALLEDAEVDPRRVLVVHTDPETPCWYHRWGWLDYHLRVYKRFGTYSGGASAIGIDGGRVVSLSLVGTQLSNLVPLIDLPMLHTLRLRANRIETLAGVPGNCRWTHLDLSENDLTDLDAAQYCTDLRELHLERNHLRALPPLHKLTQLEKLNARLNVLEDASGLTGHPALQQVELYGNRLTSAQALAHMPWLERVELGDNALTTLDLGDLPGLQNVQASSNRIEQVDRSWLAQYPELRYVNLERNPLRALPPGFVRRTDAPYSQTEIHPADSTWPILEVGYTPVAERLQDEAYAAHDGSQRHTVAELPRAHGRWQKVRSHGATRTGFSSRAQEQGRADWLQGVQSRSFEVDAALSVSVTASVEQGRLRVYLKSTEAGYQYAEALPGKPLRISGRLITGTTRYLVYFEAVGGRAEGVAWTIES